MNWQGIVDEVVREVSGGRSASGRRPPEKLYHGTFGWNSDAVAMGGIAPGLGPSWSVSDPRYMYLAESPELAANWVREAYIERDIHRGRATASVFKVDTAAIGPVEPDPKGGSADWRHRGAIPPSAIRLVYEADYTNDIPDDEDMPDDMPDGADGPAA